MSNIKIGGLIRKKKLQDYSHDNTTTSTFGFLQPACAIRELSAGETVDLDYGQFVRLNSMPKPTYSRLSIRTYTGFVPAEDIWHAFPQFASGKPYKGVGGSYIPTKTPYFTNRYLCAYLSSLSYCTLYQLTDPTFSDNGVKWTNISPVFSVSSAFDNALANAFPGWHAGHTWVNSTSAVGYSTIKTCDLAITFSDSSKTYIVCIRLNTLGKCLRKILIGIGWQPNWTLEPISALPLVAYYKMWFDLFAPQRNITWKETNAFQLMEYIEQYNLSSSFTYDSRTAALTYLFLDDLTRCFYTQEPDWVSMHIDRAANLDRGLSAKGINAAGNSTDVVSSSTTGLPSISTSTPTTYFQNKMLEVLTKWANKDTAIGGRIKDWMFVHGFGSYLDNPTTDKIFHQSIEIQVSDVMATTAASTQFDGDQALGDYAGRGIARSRTGEGKHVHIEANCVGFLVSMMTIVPESYYCQQVSGLLKHINPEDYWHPELDGTTLVPTPVSHVMGQNEFFIDDQTQEDMERTSFGNIPVYSEYSHQPNILNGDISLRSKRASLLPYTLDKWLTPPDVASDGKGLEGWLHVNNGTAWRYVDPEHLAWLGNYDRMFNNTDGVAHWLRDDNFIIHCYCQLKSHSYRIPLGNAFDTESFQEGLEVQHA